MANILPVRAGLNVALEQLFDGALGVRQIGAMAGVRHVVNLGRERAKAGFVGLHFSGERH
jgi:hypothetical protein